MKVESKRELVRPAVTEKKNNQRRIKEGMGRGLMLASDCEVCGKKIQSPKRDV